MAKCLVVELVEERPAGEDVLLLPGPSLQTTPSCKEAIGRRRDGDMFSGCLNSTS